MDQSPQLSDEGRHQLMRVVCSPSEVLDRLDGRCTCRIPRPEWVAYRENPDWVNYVCRECGRAV